MDIEEAKDILLNIIADEVIGTYCIEIQKEVDCSNNCKDEDCYLIQAIDTVISKLDEKDKVINSMAELIYKYINLFHYYEVGIDHKNKDTVIEYFRKKGEKNE